MSLLKQIDDKGAVLEWSPLMSQSNMVALGTKDSAGLGFDDYGGVLELHMLDFSNPSTSSSVLMGHAKARYWIIGFSRSSPQLFALSLLDSPDILCFCNPSSL